MRGNRADAPAKVSADDDFVLVCLLLVYYTVYYVPPPDSPQRYDFKALTPND